MKTQFYLVIYYKKTKRSEKARVRANINLIEKKEPIFFSFIVFFYQLTCKIIQRKGKP